MSRRLGRLVLLAAFAIGLGFGLAGVAAQESFKQVPLSEPVIVGFIAAQKDMIAIADKMQGAGSDSNDPKMQSALDAAARKHGFKDFTDYEDVAVNITMIMMAIDPKSGVFTDPIDAIRKDIEMVKADKSINEKERKQRLEELQDELKITEPVKFPGNVDLVKKHHARIAEVLQ